jgi:hypothetical protein
MKKVFIAFAALAMVFTSCSEDKKDNLQEQNVNMDDWYVYTDADVDEANKVGNEKLKSCYSMVNLNRLLNENPGLERKMYNIEYQTRALIAAKKPSGTPGGGGGGNDGGGGDPPVGDGLDVINIPVVVHVVMQNPSIVTDGQISAQIDVLNEDFSAGNSDLSSVPSEFSGLVANTDIQFTLAKTNRVTNGTSAWSTNDAVKYASPVESPSTQLNIWICNISGGILGYAQFPGGPSATDGIVLLYSSLPGGSAAAYNLGRTATHEVGHYLNLRHIWGDGRCNRDDFVSDTPISDAPNYGCPSYPTVNCRSTDMTMNYMDYTYDACMYMYSEGQKTRMRAVFASGGPRASMLP